MSWSFVTDANPGTVQRWGSDGVKRGRGAGGMEFLMGGYRCRGNGESTGRGTEEKVGDGSTKSVGSWGFLKNLMTNEGSDTGSLHH